MRQYQNAEYLHNEYVVKERPIRDIAKENMVSATTIFRNIKKCGLRLRDKSVAQTNALKTNRAKHPTKGLKRSLDVKSKISQSRGDAWANESEEYRERLVLNAIKRWESLPEEFKQTFRRNAVKAFQATTRHGSKLEQYLLVELGKQYAVVFHCEQFEGKQLETDLLLPELRIAVEVDGPTHHKVVWDADKLKKQKALDRLKNSMLQSNGYSIIRIKTVNKAFSKYYGNKVLTAVEDLIKYILKQGRLGLYEVEVA